jgi:ribosomal protein S18 acetylase RimI-like enzyme
LAVGIRTARPEDDSALRDIDRMTWAWDNTPGPPPAPGTPFFTERSGPDDVLVAADAQGVVGYVRLSRATPLESNRHVLEISGLAVHPDRQRQGIARSLLAAAADAARTRGCRKLRLRVLSPNEPALALYESCGYRVEGMLAEEFFLDGRYVDDVVMALDLTRPGSGRT